MRGTERARGSAQRIARLHWPKDMVTVKWAVAAVFYDSRFAGDDVRGVAEIDAILGREPVLPDTG